MTSTIKREKTSSAYEDEKIMLLIEMKLDIEIFTYYILIHI
jgi:hypothetical protein